MLEHLAVYFHNITNKPECYVVFLSRRSAVGPFWIAAVRRRRGIGHFGLTAAIR